MEEKCPAELAKFAEILKELMLDHEKMSILKLAENLGCDYTTAQRYTSGQTLPDLVGLFRLSKIFDVPAEYFFTYTEEDMKRWNEKGNNKHKRVIRQPESIKEMLDEIERTITYMQNTINATRR